MRRPSTVTLAIVMAFIVVSWSGNYVVGKIGLREIPALALASFRIVVAGLTMLPVWIALKLSDLRRARQIRFAAAAARSGPALTSGFSPRNAAIFACLGFFGIVVNQGCFTVGLSDTSVSHSSIIVGGAPILILLLAWSQRLERLTKRKILGLALAFAGAAVLGSEQGWSLHSAGMRGDLLTLCGGIGLAIYTVMGKRVASAYDAVRLNVWMNFFAAAGAAPIAIWEWRMMTRTGAFAAIGWQGWGAVLYMGIIASALTYLLYFWTLRYVSASGVGALSYLQPVGATLLGIAVLGEALTRTVVLGGVLIMVGVYAIESHPHSSGTEEREELLA